MNTSGSRSPSAGGSISAARSSALSDASEARERRERLLTQGTPSITRSIAEALVIKNENLFFLATQHGQVPLDEGHGYGLYHNDCRYLSGYRLLFGDAKPNALVATDHRGFMAIIELSNSDLRTPDGHLIPRETVSTRWERVVHGETLTLLERLTVHNFGQESVRFPVSLTFRSEFEDIFIVRGLLAEHPGDVKAPEWKDGSLHLSADGIDGIRRSVTIRISPAPSRTDGTTAHLDIELDSHGELEVTVAISVHETDATSDTAPEAPEQQEIDEVILRIDRANREWAEARPAFRSDALMFNRIIGGAERDLHMLGSRRGGDEFFSAGVPWFATLFGRDAAITALQILMLDPDRAADTLRLLARYQGTKTDAWRDEEPGKVLHELRVGELANAGEVPHTPYYGTVDATLLFLILLARHAEWTGELTLFDELRENVEAALRWMTEYGDRDGDGYIEYRSATEHNLINQGWKDSGDAIVNRDGSLAEPPIALVEVQAYAHEARVLIAGLFRRSGDDARAQKLERDAERLRVAFNRDFWLEDEGCFALALDGSKRAVAVVSSNPGHALWSGIVDEDKAARVMKRLMKADVFSGWGIRTLSTNEQRYNPVGYHLGTVWPHENGIIAEGFRRYGFDPAARRIVECLLHAATHFRDLRFPELFAGFPRDEFQVPVHFPTANHPQAWGAGSVVHLLQTMLGIRPDAFGRRLRIVRPFLPEFVGDLEVHGLRIGSARVDLRFERKGDYAEVETTNVEGELEITVESGGASGRE